MPRTVRRKAARGCRSEAPLFVQRDTRAALRVDDSHHSKPMNPAKSFRTEFPFEGARIPVFVAVPAVTPKVTVVMLGPIWSVTEHIEDLCLKLADQEIGAIAPCLFRGENIPA